jgi:hypothetical protein
VTRDAQAPLTRAQELLTARESTTVGNSARLAAFLARQAVGELIDDRCANLYPRGPR